MRRTCFSVGDRVLVWCPDLVALEGNKIAPLWIGPYFVRKTLSPTSYLLLSEQGTRSARVHANRLRRTNASAKETRNPRDGDFSDNLRLIRKIKVVKDSVPDGGAGMRLFKVQMSGLCSLRWTREEDPPEAVVTA